MASILSAPHFHNEEAAYLFVEKRIWPNGPVCPRCNQSDRVGKMGGQSTRIGTYKCYACRKPFTVKVGTVFESSHVPMRLWLQAIFLIASSKKGISANQLHRTLGITLKSAWFLGHRIREAMKDDGLVVFGHSGGDVEADETYIGRDPFKKLGRGGQHKMKVLSLVDRKTRRAKSIVVEFRDHIMVIDAPATEARSIAVIDAVKKIIPGKPIRYIVNTHLHFDHSGGLRTYAAEGATVITHRDNIPYYEQAWANPRTISPDRLSKSGRKPVFEGVVGNRMFTDGSRDLYIYHYAGNMHNAGMLMIYLPKEKILIEADSWSPPANPNAPLNAVANLVHWYEAVQRLNLDVEQIIPSHGNLTTLQDARKVMELHQSTDVWTK